MTVYSVERLDTGIARQSKTPYRIGRTAAPSLAPQRVSRRRSARIGTVPSPAPAADLSIEEQIARYVAQQPPQLYRGGA